MAWSLPGRKEFSTGLRSRTSTIWLEGTGRQKWGLNHLSVAARVTLAQLCCLIKYSKSIKSEANLYTWVFVFINEPKYSTVIFHTVYFLYYMDRNQGLAELISHENMLFYQASFCPAIQKMSSEWMNPSCPIKQWFPMQECQLMPVNSIHVLSVVWNCH